jgi:hypothetical protein
MAETRWRKQASGQWPGPPQQPRELRRDHSQTPARLPIPLHCGFQSGITERRPRLAKGDQRAALSQHSCHNGGNLEAKRRVIAGGLQTALSYG